MQKAIIFGFGNKFLNDEKEIRRRYEIVGIVDNDKKKQGLSYKGIPVCCVNDVLIESGMELEYDVVLVTPLLHRFEMIHQLLDIGLSSAEIVPWFGEGGHSWRHISYSVDELGVLAECDGIRCLLRHDSDFCVFEEIFLRNVYSFYAGESSSVVFDIGMNIGIASLFFSSFKNVDCIYGFEPFLETYRQARENVLRNDNSVQKKITAFNFALSNYDGNETFRYNRDFSGGMRIDFGSERESTDVEGKIEIRDAAAVLASLFERHKKRKIVMKIDCEGSEYRIFHSLEAANLLENIDVFLMETHDKRENEIKTILRAHHYAYFDQYKGGEGDTGMIYALKI